MKKRLPRLKDQLTDNGAYKVVALIVALVIWVTLVSSRKDVVLIKDLRVEFLSRSAVAVELLNTQDRLQVKLAGPRNLLKRFSEGNYRVRVDATRFDQGEYTLKVDERLLDLPPGLKLLKAEPQVLNFRLLPREG